MKAFAELGYHGTTTRDIATAAHLSPGGLYVHYRSKEDLLYAIIEQGHQSLLGGMRSALASCGGATATERLTALVKAHVRYHAEESDSARISSEGLRALSLDKRNAIIKLRREVERLVEDALSSGIASGEFAIDDVRYATFFILSASIGVARWFHPGGSMTAEELAEKYASFSVRAVRSSDILQS